MVAIQDQTIPTRNYRKHILKDNTITTDKCRRCNAQSETIEHIISGCKMLAQIDYKHRHDQVAKILHQRIGKKYELIEELSPYYEYTPQTILESKTHKIYWDRTIITDKTIKHNRPDITLIDKINKSTTLIDIAVPNTHNLKDTYTEKIRKYTDLSIEIKKQWQMNTVKIVPIIISATGIIPKSLIQNLEAIGIEQKTYIEMQKATILNTCNITRRFLHTNT